MTVLLVIVDKTSGKLSADITATKDLMLKRSPCNFEKHVKNIYRTLLSRGMKGCYVYYTDKEKSLIQAKPEDMMPLAN